MKTCLGLLLLASSFPQPDPDESIRRQFDFWIGEWAVQNRHLQPDGEWRDGDVTRARITPVCGGRAVLEEWAGPFGGSFMNGFSLRAWNPAAEQWALLLFWTTDGNSTFGQLTGTFRHGRGEFFTGPPAKNRTRMRGPEVAKVSRARRASNSASRVFASAHTPARPAALHIRPRFGGAANPSAAGVGWLTSRASGVPSITPSLPV